MEGICLDQRGTYRAHPLLASLRAKDGPGGSSSYAELTSGHALRIALRGYLIYLGLSFFLKAPFFGGFEWKPKGHITIFFGVP